MICEFCGHEIPDNAKFCPNCATLVTPPKYKKQPVTKTNTTATKTPPQKQQTSSVKVTEKSQEQPVPKQVTEKKVVKKPSAKSKISSIIAAVKSINVNKRLLAIGCAGLAIIIALIILFASIFGGSGPKTGMIKASIVNGNAYFYYGNGESTKLSYTDGIASATLTADYKTAIVQTKNGTLYTTDANGQNMTQLYQAKEGSSVEYTLWGNKVLYHTFTYSAPVKHAYFVYDLRNKSLTNILNYTASSKFQGIALSSSSGDKAYSNEYSIILANEGKIGVLNSNKLNDGFVNIASYDAENEKISGLYCSNNGKNAIWTVTKTDAKGKESHSLFFYYNNSTNKVTAQNASSYMLSSINSDVSLIFTANSVFYIKDNWLRSVKISNATSAYTLDGAHVSSATSVGGQSGCLITSRGTTGTNVYYLDYADQSSSIVVADATNVYHLSKNKLLYKKDKQLMLGTLNTSDGTLTTKKLANDISYVYVTGDDSNYIYYTYLENGQTKLIRYDVNSQTSIRVSENASSIKLGTNGEKIYFIENVEYANVSFGSLFEFDARSEKRLFISNYVVSLSLTSNTISGEIIPNKFFYQTLRDGELQAKYYNGSESKTVITIS